MTVIVKNRRGRTVTLLNPMKDKTYNTIPLTSSIDKNERIKTNNKNVFPRVFVGKRSALGKENENYELVKEDNNIVNKLFLTLPRENVPYTTNLNKKNKKRKCLQVYDFMS